MPPSPTLRALNFARWLQEEIVHAGLVFEQRLGAVVIAEGHARGLHDLSVEFDEDGRLRVVIHTVPQEASVDEISWSVGHA